MIDIDNAKAIEELLNQNCLENESPEPCMMKKGCSKCKAEYLSEHGVKVPVFGEWKEVQ